MSNKELLLIKQRIGDIQCGLLRFEDKNKQVTLQVKLTANEDTSLNCVVSDEFSGRRFVNKNVHLIQKYHDDYLHIAGKVSDETESNTKILAVQIERACWFVRRSRGNVSWLWQKYLYETDEINNSGKAADLRA